MINSNIKVFLIGVSDYSRINLRDLYGTYDAEIMEKAIKDGLKVPRRNITVMGIVSRTILLQDFIDSLKLEIQKLNKDDIFIFYFSGHGGKCQGKHALVFSDGCINTQDIIEYIEVSEVGTKIVFIDACYTGSSKLAEKLISENEFATSFLGKGTMVLASCREKETSTYFLDKPISVFTSILAGTITTKYLIKKGVISMEDIVKHVSLEADAWNSKYTHIQQTPVYCSNVIGDVTFCIEDYQPYRIKEYYSEHDEYIIKNVEDLSTGNAKRYSVKVITKFPENKKRIARISNNIVDELKYLDIFRNSKLELLWKGKPTNIVFIYYGRDEADLDGNFEYFVTWVDDKQDKDYWYRNKEEIENIGVKINDSYNMLRKFVIQNTGDKEVILNDTRYLLNHIINFGNKIVAQFRAYLNGNMDEEEFVVSIFPLCEEISGTYLKLSDLDIAPAELLSWSNLCMYIAGNISDMTLFYNADGMKKRTRENRIACMEMTIKHYQQNLKALKDEEERLDIVRYQTN